MSSRTSVRPTGVEPCGHVVLVGPCGRELSAWPLPGVADLVLLDRLARVQLAAHRLGCSIRLRDVGDELGGLLELTGLAAVVPQE
jgi:hypothetical protein